MLVTHTQTDTAEPINWDLVLLECQQKWYGTWRCLCHRRRSSNGLEAILVQRTDDQHHIEKQDIAGKRIVEATMKDLKSVGASHHHPHSIRRIGRESHAKSC